jgi:hypothetical protein
MEPDGKLRRVKQLGGGFERNEMEPPISSLLPWIIRGRNLSFTWASPLRYDAGTQGRASGADDEPINSQIEKGNSIHKEKEMADFRK